MSNFSPKTMVSEEQKKYSFLTTIEEKKLFENRKNPSAGRMGAPSPLDSGDPPVLAEPAPEQSLRGPSVYQGGQSLKLSTKAAVFKRVSLLIGEAKLVD